MALEEIIMKQNRTSANFDNQSLNGTSQISAKGDSKWSGANYLKLKVEGHEGNFTGIICHERLNDIRYLNKFLEEINLELPIDGEVVGWFEEYQTRKGNRVNDKLFPLKHFWDFVFHRLLPKLPLTKGVYFNITKGKNRVLSKAEAFGRIYSCGFEITEEVEQEGHLCFKARKVRLPYYDLNPSYGPLIKLKRVGKGGRPIGVYKLRTMYPYSEYLQDYVFKKNELEEGGKFKDDFRISKSGKFLRKVWLDELPMLINLLKGEMKIVGVRPLSKQYFNLYPPELQKRRIRTKPGLLPPFYADLPKTLDEIVESEMKYLEAYDKNPLLTDVSYFLMALKNILIKGARSK